MSSREREGLFDAILASAEDDTPRLVYADWLEENGEPDRAEFIRGQIRLAGINEWDEGAVELEIRCRSLLQAHRDEWLAPLQGIPRNAWFWDDWHMFSRGFPERREMTAQQFLGAAEQLFTLAPFRGLALHQDYQEPEYPEGFWGCPALRHLRQLWIYRNYLSPRQPGQLLQSAPRLVKLALPSDLVSSPGQVVASAPCAPHLRRLEIASRETDPAVWRPLWRTKALGRLECFGYRTRWNLPAHLTFTELTDAPWFAGLRRLDLAGDSQRSPLLTAGLGQLLRAGHLRALSLVACGVPESEVEGIRALPSTPLKHLDLGPGQGISRNVLRALLQAAGLAGLHSFSLSGNGNAALTYLSQSPVRQSLRVLRLSGCKLSGVLRLARAGCKQLARFTLGLNPERRRPLPDEVASLPAVVEAFLDPQAFPRLVSLTITSSSCREEGEEPFAKHLLRLLAKHPGAARLKELGLHFLLERGDLRHLLDSSSLGRLSRLEIPAWFLGRREADKAKRDLLLPSFGSRLDDSLRLTREGIGP